MRFLRDVPLQQKLSLITLLTNCAALVLACLAFVIYEQVVFRQSMIRDLSSMAKMIGDNSSAALSFQDTASAELTLKSLSADPHVVGGAVYDKDGKIFAKYRRAGAQQMFLAPPVEADGHRFGDNYLKLFRRIELAGESVGTVYVQSDLEEVRARLWRYALIVAGVMFTSILVAYLLSRRLQKVISEPISHLARVANTVALEKNYSVRAVKHGEDELGRLIDGFNEMLAQIQTRDRALEQAREDLERRVQERTCDLRASEERIRLIVDTAFDAIVSADANGTIIEWNTQAEKTFGWPRSEAMGRKLSETIVPPKFRQAHELGLKRFLATGEPRILNRRQEMTALHKDGHEFSVELAVSPIRLGENFLFSAFLRDITDRKRAEAKLEEAHRQLLDTSRQAGMAEVATGVLHNVGNVLNSVNVSASMVADRVKKSKAPNLAKVVALLQAHAADLGSFLTADAKGRQVPVYLAQLAEHLANDQAAFLREMSDLRENIEHIKEIVSMQQSYAKVSGVIELVNVADLVEDSLRMNAAALERHRVQVTREYESAPAVSVEKHKVLQILVNLIRNAKYACVDSNKEDKRLTIRVSCDSGCVCIAVIDNGVGIPAENLTRIFSLGFTTRRDGHGFGLHSGALAAKELGGSLKVRSDGIGQGAVFTLELPLDQRQPLAA